MTKHGKWNLKSNPNKLEKVLRPQSLCKYEQGKRKLSLEIQS